MVHLVCVASLLQRSTGRALNRFFNWRLLGKEQLIAIFHVSRRLVVRVVPYGTVLYSLARASYLAKGKHIVIIVYRLQNFFKFGTMATKVEKRKISKLKKKDVSALLI